MSLIALLADIHGNHEALTACLDHAKIHGCTRYVFLGDYVGYGADPHLTVKTVKALVDAGEAIAVQGNHDHAASFPPGAHTGHPKNHWNPDAKQTIDWARSKLSPELRGFLQSLPLTAQPSTRLFFAHANGWDPAGFEYLLGTEAAQRHFQAVQAGLSAVGHTHDPVMYHMGASQRAEQFRPLPGTRVPITSARRWILVPGSVGQARDGNPTASYAIYDDQNPSVVYWRVPYDHHAAASKIRLAGLPERFAHLLLYGN